MQKRLSRTTQKQEHPQTPHLEEERQALADPGREEKGLTDREVCALQRYLTRIDYHEMQPNLSQTNIDVLHARFGRSALHCRHSEGIAP